MTFTRQDIQSLNHRPGTDDQPLTAAHADHIAAVLNSNGLHRPATDTTGDVPPYPGSARSV